MLGYANSLGDFLSGFTGEHVGEPRVLICLYDNPLLHVDIKFVTLDEFHTRIETPVVLLDKDGQLEETIRNSQPHFPYPDFQWIEDRFWTWIHYALLKIGRGEYFEAFDFMGFLRMVVFGPLLHIKNDNLPRGVRKAETDLASDDLEKLKRTIPNYDRQSLLHSLRSAVSLYREIRVELFDNVILQRAAEVKVMAYFDEIDMRQFTIRRGQPSDIVELQQLFVDTITTVCSSDYDAEQIAAWTSSVDNKQRWDDIMNHQFVIVAQHADKIVGFATLDNGSYIDLLYVHKDHQRQGIAQQLLDDIETEARRLNQTVLTSDVSITAKSFFQRNNFIVATEQVVVRNGVNLTNFKVTKSLH
jgi:GNAT superfamily N-acetyltransferase